jgi:anthranilate synthase component 1
MEIIEELEPARRGTYGGAVLYADFSGNLDSCIAIRSMLAIGGKGYVQAGAGIVADSVPELEHQESINKAQGRDPRHRAWRSASPSYKRIPAACRDTAA